MRRHRFASHTAEELRRLSNLGHLVEGLVLATPLALQIAAAQLIIYREPEGTF
jgi:hypothetical protein